MTFDERNAHDGHRARMRRKLLGHGQRIFDTYELLEMLLYYGVPRRDTNPIAKALLSGFGSLDGVLSAGVDELIEFGIPERAARLVSEVGRADAVGRETNDLRPVSTFDDYQRAGLVLADYLEANTEYRAAIMLLDDTMRMLGVMGISTPRFGSAATTAKPFIDAAISVGATVAVIAFTNRNSLLFPFEADVVTAAMLESELSGAGVRLFECFITAGRKFSAVGPRRRIKCGATPEMQAFLADRERCMGGECEALGVVGLEGELALDIRDGGAARLLTLLTNILSYTKCPEGAAKLLADRYGSLDGILAEHTERLAALLGESAAIILKLTAALTSRRMSDKFAFGVKHTDKEMVDYLESMLYGLPNETVYMLSIDASGRVKACDIVGEGVVNAADVYTRRVLECALSRRAASVIIAHNHPTGSANPSEDDMLATATINAACRAAGIRLLGHIIFAKRDHFLLEPDLVTGAIMAKGRMV